MKKIYGLGLLATLVFLFNVVITMPPPGSPGLPRRTISEGASGSSLFTSAGEHPNSVARRTARLTGTSGDYGFSLVIGEQLMSIQVAAGAIESFYQSVMGKSISYSLTSRPGTPSFKFRKGTLVLLFVSVYTSLIPSFLLSLIHGTCLESNLLQKRISQLQPHS